MPARMLIGFFLEWVLPQRRKIEQVQTFFHRTKFVVPHHCQQTPPVSDARSRQEPTAEPRSFANTAPPSPPIRGMAASANPQPQPSRVCLLISFHQCWVQVMLRWVHCLFARIGFTSLHRFLFLISNEAFPYAINLISNLIEGRRNLIKGIHYSTQYVDSTQLLQGGHCPPCLTYRQ